MQTEPQDRTGQGWAVFSGIMMLLAGINLFFNGLWALNANSAIENTFKDQLLFSDNNLDTWGWIYVVVGAVVIVAGIAVFSRAQWARWIGVFGAAIGMFAAFFWLFTPYWPSALVSVVLYGLVLYGLSVYGNRFDY